jgi:hypothetical protein
VTNLVLDVGDFVDVGKPVLAIVDSDSFRVEAYPEETKLINSRLCCHGQWYLAEGAEELCHGLCQALRSEPYHGL